MLLGDLFRIHARLDELTRAEVQLGGAAVPSVAIGRLPVRIDCDALNATLETARGHPLPLVLAKADDIGQSLSLRLRTLHRLRTNLDGALKVLELSLTASSALTALEGTLAKLPLADGDCATPVDTLASACNAVSQLLRLPPVILPLATCQSLSTFTSTPTSHPISDSPPDSQSKTTTENPPLDLQAVSNLLLSLASSNLTAACASSQDDRVIALLRLFPLIAQRAHGLDIFAAHLASLVRRNAQDDMRVPPDSSLTYFPDLLLSHYSLVATTTDTQTPFVNAVFGPAWILYILKSLYAESEARTRMVIDAWLDERDVARKLLHVESRRSKDLKPDLRADIKRSTQSSKDDDADQDLDPRQLDALLTEYALISERIRLFLRFLQVRWEEYAHLHSSVSYPALSLPGIDKSATTQQPTTSIDDSLSNNPQPLSADESRILNSLITMPSFGLESRLDEWMKGYFTLEQWFAWKGVEKAIKIDTCPASSISISTSSLDDVFFILQKSLQRCITTRDVGIVINGIALVSRVVGRVVKIWEDMWRSEKTPFINNIDLSANYILKVVNAVTPILTATFSPLPPSLEQGLTDLREFSDSLRSILRGILDKYYANTLRSRVRMIVADAFRGVKLSPEENEELGIAAKIVATEKLIAPYRSRLTSQAFTYLFQIFLDHLVTDMERQIATATPQFNLLGSLRMERDVLDIMKTLGELVEWSLRERFWRVLERVKRIQEGLGVA